ncbi:porin [Galenea microaerophila]
MKKNIIALAIASSVVAAPSAMAAPTVYGSVHMAVESISVKDVNGDKDKQDSGIQVNNHDSRFGLKGDSDLGNGLKAIYKLEFGVQIDNASKTKTYTDSNGDTVEVKSLEKQVITNRNQYVGLAGGFGAVLLGRHDTPFKMAQAKDFFGDTAGDIKYLAGGLGAFGKGGENRVSNVLAYVSPSFNGVKVVAAFVPKETGGDTTKESSLTDLMSAAVMYGSKKKGLYLAAAMDSASKEVLGGTDSASHLRLVAQYTVSGLTANVMYQDFSGKALDNTNQKGTTLSAGVGYKIGKFMPKAQIMSVDRDKNASGDKYNDSTNYGLGLDYALGKKTTAYVNYVAVENTAGVTTTDKSEKTTFAIGVNHKF